MKGNKTLLCNFLTLLLTLTASIISLPSQAASDDECAIWMCLPSGFPSGCSGAKSAFKDRVKHFKPALPNFHECVKDTGNSTGGDQFTAKNGIAAFIPSYKVCVRSEYVRRGSESQRECVEWKQTLPEYKKGQRCRYDRDDKQRYPLHCTRTYKYSEVYRNGVQYGETHYY